MAYTQATLEKKFPNLEFFIVRNRDGTFSGTVKNKISDPLAPNTELRKISGGASTHKRQSRSDVVGAFDKEISAIFASPAALQAASEPQRLRDLRKESVAASGAEEEARQKLRRATLGIGEFSKKGVRQPQSLEQTKPLAKDSREKAFLAGEAFNRMLDAEKEFERTGKLSASFDQPKEGLPARTADTMSEAIALSSPAGKISKRAKTAAEKRLAESLFGPSGLQRGEAKQPTEVERLERRAAEAEGLAARGMRPRANKKLAEELRTQAIQVETRDKIKDSSAEDLEGGIRRTKRFIIDMKEGDPLKEKNQIALPIMEARLAELKKPEARPINIKELAESLFQTAGGTSLATRSVKEWKARLSKMSVTDLAELSQRQKELEKQFPQRRPLPSKKITTLITPTVITKETPSLSFRAAEARFARKTAGTGRSKQRNPALDEQRQAKVVAPAVAKTEEDLKLQRRWFKNPNQLDFEGVDTKKEKPKTRIKSSKL